MNNRSKKEIINALSRAQESLEAIDFHGDSRLALVEDMNDTISALLYELIGILDDEGGGDDD